MTFDQELAMPNRPVEPHRVTVLPNPTDPGVDVLERALGCHECGLRLLALVVSSPAWVTRRVEAVSFRDHRTVRRRVSIDFAVPASAPQFVVNDTWYRLLPLTIMRRKSLVNFDLRDETDASVSLLGLRQNQAVTLALVEALANAVLKTNELPPEAAGFLRKLVVGDQPQLIAACEFAEDASAPPDVRRLVANRSFNHVMKRVAEDFVMFVFVPVDGPARRVYKFRYDEPMSRRYRESGSKANGYRRFTAPVTRFALAPKLAALGWTPTRNRFPTPAAENAARYHFEIHAPEGVAIDSAKILAGRPEARAGREPSVDQVAGGLPTVDLHVVDVERGSLSRAQVDLRLAADSWLTLATACAWLTAAALFWAASRLGSPDGRENDAASALFITFTVALAAILWRPPEHRMAMRLLSRVGLLAYTSCLLLLVAAALFVFERSKQLNGRLFTLGGLAVVTAVLLSVTLVRVLVAANRERILSPWEQGRGIAEELEGASHDGAQFASFEAASEHLGFTTPAIKVGSAEADTAATLMLDDELIDEMRALLAAGLAANEPE